MNGWGIVLGAVAFGVLGYYLGHFSWSRQGAA
jgi:hypothetical protein